MALSWLAASTRLTATMPPMFCSSSLLSCGLRVFLRQIKHTPDRGRQFYMACPAGHQSNATSA